MAEEFEALGVPFRQRGALTDECMAIMKELWTKADPRYRSERWRDGRMIRRWVGLGLGRAATRFRRIKGQGELNALATALRKKSTSEVAA